MLYSPVVNITDYHYTAVHSHKALLRKTAEQQGVVLERNLLECKGCAMSKGLRRCTKQPTHTRAGKKLGRVFVGLRGPMMIKSHGEKRYTLIVRDDFSRYMWVYFMRQESNAAETFKHILSDTRADGVPSQVVTVRSDGGDEFCGGVFGDICRSRCIKQKSPRPSVPIQLAGRASARFD